MQESEPERGKQAEVPGGIWSSKFARLAAFLLAGGLWAVIYLPNLGYLELQGEEGRRILPAVHMLQGGSWLVPQVGGEEYFNKPPGINWIAAASFKLTGRQDEFAARLPSALFYLAFITLLLWMPGGFLDIRARLAAAVVFLTAGGLMEKGRLIEIEGIVVAFTGLALVWWLNAFVENRSSYFRWVVPCLLLACGALVKGPFLAIPFYAAVICVLAYHRRLKDLVSPGHLVGIALILLLCGGWFVAVGQQVGWELFLRKLRGQLGPRYTRGFSFVPWIENVALGLANLLPWLIFLPVLWVRRLSDNIPAEQQRLFRALRLGLVLGFAGMCAMTVLLARYTLPALPLGCILIGWVLSRHAQFLATDRIWRNTVLAVLGFLVVTAVVGVTWQDHGVWARLAEKIGVAWQNRSARGWVGLVVFAAGAGGAWVMRERIRGGLALTLLTGLACALVLLQYVLFVMPSRQQHARFRPAAAAIDQAIPPGQTLYAFRPGYQPLLFYVRTPVRYVLEPDQIDAQVGYLLIEKDDSTSAEVKQRLESRSVRGLLDPPVVLKKPDLPADEQASRAERLRGVGAARKRVCEFQLFRLGRIGEAPITSSSSPQ